MPGDDLGTSGGPPEHPVPAQHHADPLGHQHGLPALYVVQEKLLGVGDRTLRVGEGEARAWGCDLTPGYIAENAAYYSS